jgi:hypothetical protein
LNRTGCYAELLAAGAILVGLQNPQRLFEQSDASIAGFDLGRALRKKGLKLRDVRFGVGA